MGSEGPVLEAGASASFQGGVCRAGPGESTWLNVPPCEPTSSPCGAHGRPQGSFTLNFRSREGAKASSQYRAAPRSPQARAAQRARPRRSALSVAKSGAAPGSPMARHGPRRRHGGYGWTFAEAECDTTQALAVTQVPRCPRADRGAPSPELPFRRLGPDSVPPPARAPPVGCRDRSRARGSAWIRRPPRGSRPGPRPRASPAGPTELTPAEPETARAPGVTTHHYSKRFRVTGGFRGCHRMPHTARRKGTQPRGYLS